ncbi:MAG: glutathione binding-like protein [Steroidobacteraceae bacterium]
MNRMRPVAAWVSSLVAIVGVAMFAPNSVAAPAKALAAASADDLTIYHIEGRRSIRVVWLCEELGIPYKLVFKQGDIKGSMQTIREVNPLMPMAPTVSYRGHILVESGGILELLQARYGKGRLAPAVSSDDYPFHLQWMHFAEGTAMYRMWAARFASMVAKIPVEDVPTGYTADGKNQGLVSTQAVFDFVEAYLAQHMYFGGQEFSAADIMMHFAVNASKLTAGFDNSAFPRIQAWRKAVEGRPAFKRAMQAAVPGGYNEYGLPTGMPLPFPEPKGPHPVPSTLPTAAAK